MDVTDFNLDDLQRMQSTLLRRVTARDPKNIRSIGFSPCNPEKVAAAGNEVESLTAQFDVLVKRPTVPDAKLIQRREDLRLLDRGSKRFRSVSLITDVREVGPVIPTGVQVSHDQGHATASVIARWSLVDPPPKPSRDPDPDDGRWSWGVITVSHLFNGELLRQPAHIERLVSCGGTPTTVGGRLEARGRIPGGPDISLIETGLDRLWLSGLLKRPDLPRVATASETDLTRWTTAGTAGTLLSDGVSHRWSWDTFYPRLHIDSLGELKHIIRYTYRGDAAAAESPFGPGVSGSVLIAGGIPIGLQIAAAEPDFTVGYAQAFSASLPWLRKRLHATDLSIVAVVGG